MSEQGILTTVRRATASRAGAAVFRVVAVLGVVLIALLGVQREQEGNRWFDVYDEGAHFDYVIKLSHGQIPSWGSTYEQETMLIAQCLGNPLATSVLDCEVKDRDPSSFAPNGYSYEAQQPPLGYLVYLPGALLSADRDPAATLNYVRDTGGALLLVIAGSLLFILATQLGLGFWRTFLLSSAVLFAPITVHAFSTVSNDPATVIVALTFVSFFLAARRRDPRTALWLGLIAGVLLGATKPYTVLLPLGMLIATVVLGLLPSRGHRRERLRALLRGSDALFIFATVGASVVVALAFTAWQAIRSTVSSSQVLSALLGFQPRVDFIRAETVISSVANLSNNWLGSSNGLITNAQLFVALNAILLVLVGVGFARVRNRRADLARLSATTWAIVVLVFSVAWPTLLLVQGHFDFDAPSRYGLLVLPLAALAATEALRRRGDRDPGLAGN